MIVRAGEAQRALAKSPLVVLLIFIAVVAGGETKASAGGRWLQPVSAREASAFWTPTRMRAAKPVEVGAPGRRGPAIVGDGGKRSPRVAALAGPSSAFGLDSVPVPDSTAPEYRIHGVIFLSAGIFGYGRCSGTAVRSRNRSVVVTAAHCLNTGGPGDRWFPGKAVFVPGYRFGQRPFGVFPVRWIDTTRQWRASGSENFDVGAMLVGRNKRGQLLGEAVGGAGIAWNRKAKQVFDVYGYPAEEPFDGETQRVCGGRPFLGHDPSSFVMPGPLNLAVSCSLNGGSSGGGWLIEGNTLNSVTSYGYFDETSPAFGAYFGNEVARLYGRAERMR
ncbi:MAG TPA: hypothetical protein VFM51_02640 [Solirubrobacterales bacterium]|nr:hypothetical protein [Solirubrobacterales bacterium]